MTAELYSRMVCTRIEPTPPSGPFPNPQPFSHSSSLYYFAPSLLTLCTPPSYVLLFLCLPSSPFSTPFFIACGASFEQTVSRTPSGTACVDWAKFDEMVRCPAYNRRVLYRSSSMPTRKDIVQGQDPSSGLAQTSAQCSSLRSDACLGLQAWDTPLAEVQLDDDGMGCTEDHLCAIVVSSV